MTGPQGNREFCFPRISIFPSTSFRETLGFSVNKIHCSHLDHHQVLNSVQGTQMGNSNKDSNKLNSVSRERENNQRLQTYNKISHGIKKTYCYVCNHCLFSLSLEIEEKQEILKIAFTQRCTTLSFTHTFINFHVLRLLLKMCKIIVKEKGRRKKQI